MTIRILTCKCVFYIVQFCSHFAYFFQYLHVFIISYVNEHYLVRGNNSSTFLFQSCWHRPCCPSMDVQITIQCRCRPFARTPAAFLIYMCMKLVQSRTSPYVGQLVKGEDEQIGDIEKKYLNKLFYFSHWILANR